VGGREDQATSPGAEQPTEIHALGGSGCLIRPGRRYRTFIETQFPVSRLSKESYKERKAGSGQTLTGLGKWWGRKPLVIVRALILGSLLPASPDDVEGGAERDREVFLRLMTMDPDGLWRRKQAAGKRVAPARVAELLDAIADPDPQIVADRDAALRDGSWIKGAPKEVIERLERTAFEAMSTDEQLTLCVRPEEIDGPSAESWAVINAHVGTRASSLAEFIAELSQRAYGHRLRVGDAFAGGGSIPFEAARVGAEAYAGDLNPVAVLLTWAALHIAGADESTAARIRASQEQLLADLRAFVDAHELETNRDGWRAEAYLYCNEVKDPVSGYLVPLAPSWIISEKEGVYAELIPDPQAKRFEIAVKSGGTKNDLAKAKDEATWSDGLKSPIDAAGALLPINQRAARSGKNLRGPRGLRRWENDDLVPRPDDVFQERLFAIRWRTPDGTRVYRAPNADDFAREAKALELLRERFVDWQAKGFIPSAEIVGGKKTDEPVRTRGWTRWHHLFAPRQLLLHGYLSSRLVSLTGEELAAGVLLAGKIADYDSRLATWEAGNAQTHRTFANQALNTTVLYPTKGSCTLDPYVLDPGLSRNRHRSGNIMSTDARIFPFDVDLFITDPPYADMVNYEELTEFFTAWYAGHSAALAQLIPGWAPDSLRAIAIKGTGDEFRRDIAEVYAHLTAARMHDDGLHIVTFTSQDIKVWRDLALILWSAGLQVTAVWTIATETTGGTKKDGSYVQGTVCLVLRKRTGERVGMRSEMEDEINSEIDRQVRRLRDHDDKDRPDFGDADLQIAGYGAALKVITGYDRIAGLDLAAMMRPGGAGGDAAHLDGFIARARRHASIHLLPATMDEGLWSIAEDLERFYLKAADIEAAGEHRSSSYEQMAKAFDAAGWQTFFADRTANHYRLARPSDLQDAFIRTVRPFSNTMLCRTLYATWLTIDANDPAVGRQWLRDDLGPRYEDRRDQIRAYLRYLARQAARSSMSHWADDLAALRGLERLIGSEEL
jgi:putative DNA methylase